MLGMASSTANNRLLKKILYYYINENCNSCYRCGAEMSEDDWSIEHKSTWLYSANPLENFFDLENISYSHKKCNYDDSRKAMAKGCPSVTSYNNGCRCDGCVSLYKRNRDKWDKSKLLNADLGAKSVKKTVKTDNRFTAKEQLGMDVSSAYNVLIRNILLDFIRKEGYSCHHCGKAITRDNYEISHKKKWDETEFPKTYFFSLDNVCFIHSKCDRD